MTQFLLICVYLISIVGPGIDYTLGSAISSPNKNLKEILESDNGSSNNDKQVDINDDDRIVNGQQAALHEFPWSVTIVANTGNGGGYFCGGSIIKNNWVLTAAHCTDAVAQAYTVTGGVYNRVSPNGEEVVRTVVSVVRYPYYNSFTAANDLGLLQLNEPFVYNKAIQPIELGPEGFKTDGVTLTVAGWGLTSENAPKQPDIIRKVEIFGINNKNCPLRTLDQKQFYADDDDDDEIESESAESIIEHSRSDVKCNHHEHDKSGGEFMKSDEEDEEEEKEMLPNSQICAGGNDGKSACFGDSGSPLMAKINNVYKAVGLVSGGRACGRAGIYTRLGVKNYLSWINSYINS